MSGTSLVRMIVDAGKASPSPPVGPALGSRGIKAMDFCKLFNAQTSHIEPNIPIRVNLRIDPKDKSYKLKLNSPPTTYFIKKHLQSANQSSTTTTTTSTKKTTTGGNQLEGAQLSLKFIYHLALLKKSLDFDDLNHISLEALSRSIAAQAKIMGIKLVP